MSLQTSDFDTSPLDTVVELRPNRTTPRTERRPL